MTDHRIVAAIGAHPDDIELGCSATIARLVEEGATVHPLILGTGAAARGELNATEQAELIALEDAARKAALTLGMAPPTFRRLPDNRFDSIAMLDITKHVERFLALVTPTLVLTHSFTDLNVDHRRTCHAVMTAARPGLTSVREVLAFEVASSTEWASAMFGDFKPTRYVEVTAEHLAKKWAAFDAYPGEMREPPHPRSRRTLEARAIVRGSEAGYLFAEAFMVLRSGS